jgi:aryl-phospho-beta-D-glucosidase BglC (GH1 family)
MSSTGAQVVLHGVDRSGTEYACVQGNGIFDGPNDQASISAMKSWGVNAVRVPLNEACWNAESYVNPAYAGANYQAAIKAYVSLLNANGMVAILDLHWTDGAYTGPSSGCSSAQAVCQKPMPDAAQAVPFWTSVAQAFKGNDAVIFDLFNEPYASRATGNTTTGWQCWLNGGTCAGISYQVAGMQSMVNAVRSAGANNVIMLGGEEYSNDLTQWLTHEPSDPDHNLTASWHSYNFNTCSSQSCWTSQVAPVIAQVPVIAGEIGENDCADGYVNPLMSWLDSQSTSYLAWAWNADFNCSQGPGLISDYTGTPTGYGAGVKAHLQSLPGG